MSLKSFLPVVALLFGGLFAPLASAVLLEYELVSQSGSRYEYSYRLTNNISHEIDWFAIFFDFGSYQNLTVVSSSPEEWDPLVAEPDSFFGDGYADWCAICVGALPVSAGSTLTGFNVAFDWIGASDNPFGSQYFEVYDTSTLEIIDSGDTVFIGDPPTTPPVGVSEPSSIILALSGVIMVLFRIRKQSIQTI